METKYCYNSKTGEIFAYQVYEAGNTTFPKGTLLAYDDYLITELNDKQEAEKCSKEWGSCNKCKSARKGETCSFCNSEVEYPEKVEYIGLY